MLVQRITSLAARMRAAIEAMPSEQLPITMSRFPAGSCGDVCLLLGAYFKDQGITDFQYISGSRGSQQKNTWTSHAWLANEHLVVDITADQFSDAPGKIIVTTTSPWHQSFKADTGCPSDFRVWIGPGTYHLHTMYHRLRYVLFDIPIT